MAISETRFVRFESCGSVTKSHTVLLCPAQEAHRPLVRCLRSRPAVGDQVTVTVSQCSCVSRPGYTQLAQSHLHGFYCRLSSSLFYFGIIVLDLLL